MSLFHHRLLMAKALEMANPYLPLDTPKAIKDAMVLYYDIAKQKATNESMAANPTLKDLSGNGNDATCYNFGWSEMSGIGGYMTRNTHYEFTKDDYVKNIINNPPEHITITFTIKGLVSGNKVTIQSLNGNVYGEWTTDGTYTVDSDSLDDSYIYIYNGIAATKGNFTVDILPLYPNALVSDGVEDYAFVQDKYDDEGNLINKKSLVLNREDGYTVIAKRKLLSTANACFTSKRKNGVGVGDNSGSFQLERYSPSTDTYRCYSFGSSNVINVVNDDIVYMTSQSYNGASLNIGNAPDSDSLAIFSLLNGSSNVIKGVLYSLLLFNRDLTDEEIQWVKNNLIQ